MPTRNINDYLESGEANDYKKGGTTDNDTLKDKEEIQALIDATTDPLDVRLQDVEGGHTVVISAISPLASQEPSGLGTPLQLTFGSAQGDTQVDPVTLSAGGAITFHKADKYILNFRAHYGRTGATGTSHLMFRFLKNGVQVGSAYGAKIENANTLIPWDSSSFIFDAEVNDVLTAEIIRDSAGDNSGGVFQMTSSHGWTTAPCCAFSIYKV